MAGLLWNFAYKEKTEADSTLNQGPFKSGNPPYLVAPGNSEKGTTVDVAKNYYWTYSKPGDVARKEVPTIYLKEKKLKVNALISQLIYSFGASVDSMQNSLRTYLNEQTANEVTRMVGGALGAAGQTGTNTAQPVLNEAGERIPGFSASLDGLKRKISSDVTDENSVYDQSPWLEPYRNLYITKDTGWEFILPYFENYQGSTQNNFSGDPTNPLLGLVKGVTDGVINFAEAANAIETPLNYSFQERAKFYNYPTDGEEFSFGFPLINTGSLTFDDVVRNWQLVFLLLYNNKPARQTKSIIEPPPVYEVRIPGVKFLPFCYITAINVEFQGSRRELDLTIPVETRQNTPQSNNTSSNLPNTDLNNEISRGAGGSFGGPLTNSNQSTPITNKTVTKNIKAIIPDAYQIKISVKSMFSESKNLLFHTVNANTQQAAADISSLDEAEKRLLNQFGANIALA